MPNADLGIVNEFGNEEPCLNWVVCLSSTKKMRLAIDEMNSPRRVCRDLP
jgi:hypothetical protein